MNVHVPLSIYIVQYNTYKLKGLTKMAKTMTREDAFKAVYGVETPKEVLGLYIQDLKQIKRKSK